MKKTVFLNSLLVLIVLFPLTTPLWAQGTGSISGTVRDSEMGQPVKGAYVEIIDTNLSAFTNSGGRFSIGSVPSGRHSLVARYSGNISATESVTVNAGEDSSVSLTFSAAIDIIELEEFVVTQFSSTLDESINRQRYSDRLVNIIGGDSLGNLPDNDLQSALNRIPGVSVSGDEGNVAIRGVQGKLNSIVLDGMDFSSASIDIDGGLVRRGEDRAIDLTTIPVEAIQEIEVIKSLTPDIDADSVGGRINLKTASAFDFEERILRANTEYRTYENGGNGYQFGLTYGDVLIENVLGIFTSFSYKNYDRHRTNLEILYRNEDDALDSSKIRIPRNYYLQDRLEKREEISFNSSLDWKLSETTKLAFKLFATQEKRVEERLRARFRMDVRNEQLGDPDSALVNENGKLDHPEDTRPKDGLRVWNETRYQPDYDLDRYSLSILGTTNLGENSFEYGASFSKSKFHVSDYQSVVRGPYDGINDTEKDDNGQRVRDAIDFQFDPGGNIITPTLSAPLHKDVTINGTLIPAGTEYFSVDAPSALFNFRRAGTYQIRHRNNEEKNFNIFLNWTRQLKTAIPVTLKVGAKFRDRDRDTDPTRERWTNIFPLSALPSKNFFIGNFGDGYPGFGPFGDGPAVVDFIDANRDTMDPDFVRSIRETVQLQKSAREKIYAGYVMATVRPTDRLTIIGGARYEKSDMDYIWTASRVTDGPFTLPDISNKQSYSDLLPSVTAVYRAGNNHVFRFAYYNTIARPDYSDLTPVDGALAASITGEDVDEFRKLPNPNLRIQEAQNFDLAWEWYYRDNDYISVSYFNKRIEDFIFLKTRETNIPLQEFNEQGEPIGIVGDDNENGILDDGEDWDFRTIERPENGGEQNLEGIEFSWLHRFKNLPEPFDRLGFQFNYTFVKGDQIEPEFQDPENPLTQTGTIFVDNVIDQPERIISAQVFWEKWGIISRVSYTYTDEQLLESDFDGAGVPRFQDKTKSIDFSLGYEFKNGWKVYVEGFNITEEESLLTYLGDRANGYINRYQYNGARYEFGLLLKF